MVDIHCASKWVHFVLALVLFMVPYQSCDTSLYKLQGPFNEQGLAEIMV